MVGIIFPKSCVRNLVLAGGWWLTPVILATQEAEISRIKVPSQPQEINSVRPYLENT
jgi:hypothetical protein